MRGQGRPAYAAPGFWARTGAIARKELRQLRRDPILPKLIILFPLALLIFYGYALNTTIKNIPLAVYDASSDRISESLITAFTNEQRFRVVMAETLEDAQALVQAGRVRGALEIPQGALEAARAGRSITYRLYVDGSDPSIALQTRAGATAAQAEVAARLIAGRAFVGSATTLPFTPAFETLYNPDNRSAVFMIPGLIGLTLTLIACLLTAIVIVREWETGTMEALIATPVKPLEVVLGKVFPYFLFGLLASALVVTAGVLIFDVPLRGSLPLLALAMLLFILGSLGVGILISTVARTQVQAMFGTIAYLFPSIFLSGFIFPIDGMNSVFRAMTFLVPLRYFLEIARGIMIRGAGLESLSGSMIAMAVFAVVMLLLASLRFQKKL